MGSISPASQAPLTPTEQPWTTSKVLQLRTGKIRPVFQIKGLKSAIYKTIRHGPVKVTKLGLEGDEQAYKDHGGVEKALLQYSSLHYLAWRSELPENASFFQPGGFGENVVAAEMNEHNVCIGDVIQIGDTVRIQVTEPRQPCYNLNHRFQVRDLSKRSQDTFRTGWYYRVLQEGYIEAGEEMYLVERPNPTWTVSKVQHYLYQEPRNTNAMQEVVKLPELGHEIHTLFSNRLRKQFESWDDRLVGEGEIAIPAWTKYKLVKKTQETKRISAFTFERCEPLSHPKDVLPGSHIRLRITGKLVRAYSIVDGDENRFRLAIALSETSRGGSTYLHESLMLGDIMVTSSRFTTSFPLHEQVDKHVFIAGGIGSTTFITAIQYCRSHGQPFHLHYLVRHASDIAFADELRGFAEMGNVTIYDKSEGNACDLTKILAQTNDNTHIYCCGSQRLSHGVSSAAKSLGIRPSNIHFEQFEVTTSGDPFEVEIAGKQEIISVGAEQSLFDALREAGLDIASACETGNCGTCRVTVSCGVVEYRGTALADEEKQSAMLSCVSRGVGKIVIEI